jgi:glutaredoxin-like protein NrdH
MNKAFLLTKDNCPQCVQLKMFLKMALRNQYEGQLELVHLETQPAVFADLVKKHKILATPAIIYGDEVLRGFEPQPVVNFLVKHFGKK